MEEEQPQQQEEEQQHAGRDSEPAGEGVAELDGDGAEQQLALPTQSTSDYPPTRPDTPETYLTATPLADSPEDDAGTIEALPESSHGKGVPAEAHAEEHGSMQAEHGPDPAHASHQEDDAHAPETANMHEGGEGGTEGGASPASPSDPAPMQVSSHEALPRAPQKAAEHVRVSIPDASGEPHQATPTTTATATAATTATAAATASPGSSQPQAAAAALTAIPSDLYSILAERPAPSGVLAAAATATAARATTSSSRSIYRPDTAYATPPAAVLRTHNGVGEGQLLYQIGKFGPLTPTYAPYWVKDPPQRPAVSDLRLSPSQRSSTCYSPEFLDFCCTPSSRPSTAPNGPSTAISSPKRLSSPKHRPGTSQVAARIYAREASPRAAHLPASPRSLPATPLSAYYKATTPSSFETGGVFVPRSAREAHQVPLRSMVKQASRVVLGAKVQSRVTGESDRWLATRHSHYPQPNEAQLRASQALSHDDSPRLPFRKKMALWGPMQAGEGRRHPGASSGPVLP